ncbi:gliding motility-associated C-terminal domain-containing protein [Mangrovibacterium marinum]|uniref:CHU domain-containing protein n=1 Tax=Mangrovibacterium marinum TaxID=1639118 RepID=A0A2T5C6J3_9BACT|nr:gliding motility-associated C-terminal domain-containing protein [Mangrovibacterium marinum]PTN10569.1 CHU domain-containing protein [Mangrovibacterium marinum]
MSAKSCYFLVLAIILLTIDSAGRPVWMENFAVADKGYWGDDDGVSVHSDLSGIVNWTLDVENCVFEASNDYVKTVSTSGGRFEALDCDGEAVWRSAWIAISGEENISCQLIAKETGSGKTEANKYIAVYYRIDEGAETLFETNGHVAGNWGEAEVRQEGLTGDSLQIIIRMKTTYASDKIMIDDILVETQEPPLLPENLAAAGDVLLNELLFNPYPDCPDFVELVNVSDKTIRTDHLRIASRDGDGNLKQVEPLSAYADYLEPGGYALFCENPDTLSLLYPQSCPENFRMADLPSMPNDGGVVVLLDDSLNVLDELVYSEKMHNPLVADEEAVSLERKSFSRASSDWENWTSAAAASGFATPGCPNSMAEVATDDTSVRLEPKAISPNGDGYNDYLTIRLQLSRPDWIVNSRVFDSAGRLVGQPQKNVTIGQQADLTWDGKRENGQELPAGIYVFFIELTNLTGEELVFKKSCTIVNGIM